MGNIAKKAEGRNLCRGCGRLDRQGNCLYGKEYQTRAVDQDLCLSARFGGQDGKLTLQAFIPHTKIG